MTRKMILAALLSAAPVSAFAMQGGMNTDLLKKTDDGVEITNEAMSGQELLNADLTDIGDPVGSVEEIILDDDGQVAFIKYNTSRFRDLDKEGTIAVSELDLETTQNFDVEVSLSNVISEDAERKMRLDSADKQSQILSNILRSDISIDGDLYDIRDVVFDDTGKAEYFLVSRTSGGFLGSADAFAVPYDSIDYNDGAFRADMDRRDMRGMVVIFQ